MPTNTPTPTPMPGGSGAGNETNSPTPTPTVTPTATPSPTPEPESGVKLTEFGYWITYPPLGPENWSTNPPPNPGPQNNTVYFDPTSASITKSMVIPAIAVRPPDAAAVIHRYGDLNGTVHVVVSVSDNDYMDNWQFSNVDNPADIWHANVTLGPGVDNVTIGIWVTQRHAYSTPGMLKLTITGVDGGYNIGNSKDFTLTVKSQTYITFDSTGDWITSSFISTSSTGFVDLGNGWHRVSIKVDRYGDTSTSLNNIAYYQSWPDNNDQYNNFTTISFSPGSTYTYLNFDVNDTFVQETTSDNPVEIYFRLDAAHTNGLYNVYPNDEVDLWVANS